MRKAGRASVHPPSLLHADDLKPCVNVSFNIISIICALVFLVMCGQILQAGWGQVADTEFPWALCDLNCQSLACADRAVAGRRKACGAAGSVSPCVAARGLCYMPHKSSSCFSVTPLCLGTQLICPAELGGKFFHRVTETVRNSPTLPIWTSEITSLWWPSAWAPHLPVFLQRLLWPSVLITSLFLTWKSCLLFCLCCIYFVLFFTTPAITNEKKSINKK